MWTKRTGINLGETILTTNEAEVKMKIPAGETMQPTLDSRKIMAGNQEYKRKLKQCKLTSLMVY